MNTQQHSSGPWEYRGFPTPLGVVFDISQAEPGVEDVAYTYSNSGNARLIASAPELLAACQFFVDYEKCSRTGEDFEMMAAYNAASAAIHAAIAKATGSTT